MFGRREKTKQRDSSLFGKHTAQERAGLPSVSMALRETPAIPMPAAFDVEQLQVPGDFGGACGQPRCPSPTIAPAQQAPLNYRTDIIISRDKRWRSGTGRCAACQRLYGEQDSALCHGHGPAHSLPPRSVSGHAGMRAVAVPGGELGSWPALVLTCSPGNRRPAGSKPMPRTPSCQTTLVQAAV